MPRLRTKFLGVLPPTTVPSFSIARSPLWQPNNRTGSASADADPVDDDATSQERLYHFKSDGNSYIKLPWKAALTWAAHATTPANASVFAFKCLVKPYDVFGRRLLYSQKGSLKSGGLFVDMLDGKLRLGWYDTVQKREVWIGTNVAVLEPHHWHYVNIRKRFPDKALGSGCYQDTVFNKTAASLNDLVLCRRFRKVAANLYGAGFRTWDYKPSATTRNFIGFTSDLEYTVAGATATGLVSREDRTFSMTNVGVVTASGAIFSEDMIGMYLAYGNHNASGLPSTFTGRYYVITVFTNSTTVTVKEPLTGANPALGAIAAGAGNVYKGGVYTGVRLVKSDGFNTSEDVDQTTYDPELFGSHLAADGESGILPFVGEYDSHAVRVASGATPDLFEASNSAVDQGLNADLADDGTDLFQNREIYAADANGVGQLHVNEGTATPTSNQTFIAVNTIDYGAGANTERSGTPNAKLQVELDPASNTNDPDAQPGIFNFLVKPIDLSRPRRVRTAFYDPEQGQVSNPGPELLIQLGGDDASNPSGSASVVLSNLPVSRDEGPIETWIYMTQADGAVYRKVAEVARGASSIAITKSEAEIQKGIVLDFDNNPPPDCRVIETAGKVLAFGNLRRYVNQDGEPQDLPNAVVYSKDFRPGTAPGANLFPVQGGGLSGVTGMRALNGLLVVTRADAMFKAALHQSSPLVEPVSSSIGCRSPAALVVHDDVLIFPGDKGPYVYPGSGVPQPVNDSVRNLFKTGLDDAALSRAVACMHRKRDQYVLVLTARGDNYMRDRLSLEPKQEQGHVSFSRYVTPALTAVGVYQDARGALARLVGGTQDGFLVWLDRDDTRYVMLGETSAIWGSPTLTAGAGSTSTKIVVSGTLDTTLAGARGALLRWGSTQEAFVLFAESGALHLDRSASVLPSNGDALTLGYARRYWKTRVLDFGYAAARKKWRYLDVINSIKSTGIVTCTAYEDFDTSTPIPCVPNTEVTSAQADQTLPYTRFDIGHLKSRFVQFAFESNDLFEIIDIEVRGADADAY